MSEVRNRMTGFGWWSSGARLSAGYASSIPPNTLTATSEHAGLFITLLGLIADTAKGLGGEARTRIIGVNWRALSGLRTFLVHRPWDVDPGIVWESATDDIPFLLSELRRHQTQQAG